MPCFSVLFLGGHGAIQCARVHRVSLIPARVLCFWCAQHIAHRRARVAGATVARQRRGSHHRQHCRGPLGAGVLVREVARFREVSVLNALVPAARKGANKSLFVARRELALAAEGRLEGEA